MEYKIIKLSLNNNDTYTETALIDVDVEIMDKRFGTFEEAVKHVEEVIYPKNKQEWADLYADEDEVETEIDSWDDCSTVITNKLDDEICFTEKYIIVEV